MSSLNVAVKCFDENRVMFGDPRQSPEKYNLYNGLAILAETVGELQMQVQQLREELQQARQEVHQLRYEVSHIKR